MITEEEAKIKWCAMARVSVMLVGDKVYSVGNRDISLIVPTNSFDPTTDITKCVASICMMWRWYDKEKITVTDIPANETPNFEPIQHDAPNPKRRGFCGLAGRPMV